MQRKMFGGHDVADKVIEYQLLRRNQTDAANLHLFDNITFVDGNSNFGEIVAIYIKKSAKHEVTNHTYGWFNEFFSEVFENLKA